MNYDRVHVVTGPLFLPKHDIVSYPVIGPNGIPVPTHFFKIVVGEIGGYFYKSSFLLPNHEIDGKTVNLEDFIVPVESIEKSSGLLFFPGLRDKSVGDLCHSKVVCKI
jgi:endonuclease G